MLYFLIGPSGVGKSELGSFGARIFKDCLFFDLDKLVTEKMRVPHARELSGKTGWNAFWYVSEEVINKLNDKHRDSSSLILVAVGAGSLCTKNGRNYFRQCPNTITIFAPAEEVIQRNPLGPNRSFQEFQNTEYSDSRMDVYNSTQYKIDVSRLNEEQARQKFIDFLQDKFKFLQRSDQKN